MTTSGQPMTKTESEGLAISKSSSFRCRIFMRPSKSRGHGKKPKWKEKLKDRKPELDKLIEVPDWVINATIQT